MTAACASLLGACGSSSSKTTTTVNSANLEQSIKASILAQRHFASSVSCPRGVLAVPGKTFTCLATTRTPTKPYRDIVTPFLVTIQTHKGYVTYVGR